MEISTLRIPPNCARYFVIFKSRTSENSDVFGFHGVICCGEGS